LNGWGATAAAATGTIAVGAGWDWGVLLFGYFASSSLLSRFRAGEKEARVRGRVEKGGQRDAAQVLANGGVFVLAAIGYALTGHAAAVAVAAGALAASTADTWATELGTIARRAPRSIVTWRAVPVGTSGGVTAEGTVASLAGATFVGALAAGVSWGWTAALGAVAGGFFGSLFDSALGGTIQDRRWCTHCALPTEQLTHVCGNATRHAGGWSWVDNDVVNALSTAAGALVGLVVWMATA
jgi:uncharacterized protein (TIGR00297 family)